MNQHEFLQNVFGDVSDKYILIWNLETKKSAWFNDIDRAAGLLKVLDSDTYIGVGLSDKDRGAHNRCRADEIVGLPGLVCDIDIAGEGHSEKAYPPTLEDALSIVKGHGIDPTLIIHSGHGIHCWWLFKEIWNFSNGDNHQAAQLSKRWGETLKQWAAEKGWTIDSVHDLSRILRPPNSWNCKNSRRVLTRTLEFDDARRYNPHDFETFFVEAGLTDSEIVAPTGTQRAAAENTATSCNVIQIDRASKDEFQKGGSGTGGAETENIVLNPMARAPQQKLFDLMEIDPKFKLTWQKKRTDFKDTSQSAYDMSIANICIQAGWSRQEIANAIIDHRTLHNSSPEKILREDYIERTINVAEKALKKNKIAEEANIVLEEAKEVCGEACIKNQEITDEQRNKYLESLGNKWGVKILRFEKHVSEDPSYILILDGYEPISFKKAEEIQDGRKFSATIAKVIDRLLPPLKVKDHIDQVNILLGCRIPIYTGYDCSRAGRIKSWVRQYINAHTKLARSEAIEYQKPYFDMDGHWYIFTKHMKGWLARAGIGNMSAEALNKDLTFIGAEEIEFKDTLSNGTRTTFRPKRIPHGVVI